MSFFGGQVYVCVSAFFFFPSRLDLGECRSYGVWFFFGERLDFPRNGFFLFLDAAWGVGVLHTFSRLPRMDALF